MGCDIHLYVEYKKADDRDWDSFGENYYMPRNYNLFALMAGVRNYNEIRPISEPRGLPEDASHSVMSENTLYISDVDSEGCATKENAERWIAQGSSKLCGENRVTHPDWHSHSWLSRDEYAKVIHESNVLPEYWAILAIMDYFGSIGYKSRVVFWFDN